ncbi:uncharacterized protein DEA37_0005510 [Paragonimus westermani]|uniref:CUB domain-containing protein n=1 Tax=Paragonimus westermani TaxID=34504 RepID=A0A5J4NJU0_9TREM|nr:uncharacterized protein DEA37_0005510 [Paragonimus westermani]
MVSIVMESLADDPLPFKVEDLELIAEVQHGLCEGYSCVANLVTVLDVWTEDIDAGLSIGCTYPQTNRQPQGELYSHAKYGVEDYPANLDCLYEIHAPEDKEIIIEIIELDIEESNRVREPTPVIELIKGQSGGGIVSDSLS